MLSRISQREIWNQDKNDKQNPLGEEIRKIIIATSVGAEENGDSFYRH